MLSKTSKSDARSSDISAPAPKPKSSMPSLLSADLRIVGDITGDADIQIEGRVEGSIKCRALTIGNSGEVKCKIIAHDVTINGNFEGQMSAGLVKIAASAKVKGDITVREALSIETGAKFEGQCKRVSQPEKLQFDGSKKADDKAQFGPQKTAAIR